MNDLRLPFKLRWAGEPMPDLSGFSEPFAIPFQFRPMPPPAPGASDTDNSAPSTSNKDRNAT